MNSFEIELINFGLDNESLKIQVNLPKRKKIDLGGFREISYGIEYLHSCVQTDIPPQRIPILNDRDTQTIENSSKSANCKREFGTQSLKSGDLYYDSRNDRIIKPGKYFDSELWLKRRTEACVYIQKMIRGYLSRKRIDKIKYLKTEIDHYRSTNIRKREELVEKNLEKEISRRIAPEVI